MMSFRSVLDRYDASELDQIGAGELLGVRERTFRRWCRCYEEEGGAGLVTAALGARRPNGCRWMTRESKRLYRSRYRGFTARHFHDHLVRDHLCRWSYSWA